MAEKRKSETELEPEDPVISLQDIIDEDAELETTANAVLGGSNDQECTYADGYVKRQALYACATCETTSDAGVCLACSLECHDGHELYELYTKRNFRCDCGSNKFPKLNCSLVPDKDSENVKNTYNHNFKGTYCTCNRPYPDPEDDVEDEMIQCVVCEDWFHGRHLHGQGVPESFGYSEMICHLCMAAEAKFLWYYNWEYTPHETSVVDVENDNKQVKHNLEAKQKEKKETFDAYSKVETDGNLGEISSSTPEVDSEAKASPKTASITENEVNFQQTKKDGNPLSSHEDVAVKGEAEILVPGSKNDQKTATHDTCELTSPKIAKINGDKVKVQETKKDDNPSGSRDVAVKEISKTVKMALKTDPSTATDNAACCILSRLTHAYEACEFPDSASFWPDGWRDRLCSCPECKVKMNKLSYLYHSDDTVAEYEKKGVGKYPESSMSSGMQALQGMNRIQQVEVIHGYNDMKSKLSEFLRSFAEESRVVTEEDIRNFFQRMAQNKRVKVDIPHSCK